MAKPICFQVEYAKSGHSKCKGCSSSIEKDNLRLAKVFRSASFGGMVPLWHHYDCFWQHCWVRRVGSIKGLDDIRWEDQQKIRKKVKGQPGDKLPTDVTYDDFLTEYAKSGKSSCRACGEKIEKGGLRLSRKDRNSRRAKVYGPQDWWYHLECFLKKRNELGFFKAMEAPKIPGFDQLDKKDQETMEDNIKNHVPDSESDAEGDEDSSESESDDSSSNGKRKKLQKTGSVKKSKLDNETTEEKALREQNQLIWHFKDQIDTHLEGPDIKTLLQFNNQKMPSGNSKVMDLLVDCMVFGALESCDQCKGQFSYSGPNVGYKCTGDVSEWTKCTNSAKVPKRVPFKISTELEDKGFLKDYRMMYSNSTKDRLFPSTSFNNSAAVACPKKATLKAESSTSSGVSSAQSSVKSTPSVSSRSGKKPLQNMLLHVIGASLKKEVVKNIRSLGGKGTRSPNNKVMACVSTKDELKDKKNAAKLKKVEELDLYVVDKRFLDDVASTGYSAKLLKKHSICSWGTVPGIRMQVSASDSDSDSDSDFDVVPMKRKRTWKKRVISDSDSESDTTNASASNPKPSTSGKIQAKATMKPLRKMRFHIIGSSLKKEGVKRILELGGEPVRKIDVKVSACISSKYEIKARKNQAKLDQAKRLDVHVVDFEFLEDVKKGGAVLLIQNHSICSWGSDPLDRIDSDAFNNSSDSDSDHENKEKMTMKGGAVVDKASELGDIAHVYKEGECMYSAVLGRVEISCSLNAYYKLQLLEADAGKSWWVFRSWGKLGTHIGGNKLSSFTSKDGAIRMFTNTYKEKTGNTWNNSKQTFVKHPNKFYPLDIDFGAKDEDLLKLDGSAGTNSKLAPKVQDLVKMLFDVEQMKKTMVEFEIDMKKMPLGKLSKQQIQQAYQSLNDLQKIVDSGAKGKDVQILDACNKFYTLIPHDFGMDKPPMLNNKTLIKSKTEMLDNLLEIELAYSLMKAGDGAYKDPIDAHYDKLKTDVQVLGGDNDEFKRIVQYVKNTHCSTHSSYELQVLEVFKVVRENEEDLFKRKKPLGNRKLLWHGSRVTNFAGILSQGLRIAPPEAPSTGYMFGKGVYFADMVSKSANYCKTTKDDNIGLLLLCDVALGNMYELTAAKYINQLPSGMNSTKGCGASVPEPKQSYFTKDGMEIPMGTELRTKKYSSLLYNEYIVYDVSQINIKYLVKMKFDYKW